MYDKKNFHLSVQQWAMHGASTGGREGGHRASNRPASRTFEKISQQWLGYTQ